MSEEKEIKIIYSDRELLVCAKPAGIPCETADEKTKILSMYGEAFLEKFEGMDFSAENAEQTHELFDAAVAHARQTVEAEKDAIIKQLRSDLVALASAPESAPAATAVGAACHR